MRPSLQWLQITESGNWSSIPHFSHTSILQKCLGQSCSIFKGKFEILFEKSSLNKGDQSCVVYGLQCKNAPHIMYIGETERPLKKRLTEHKRESHPLLGPTSNLMVMSLTPRMSMLDTDSRWLQRGIKEAYYIAVLDPDLNQDRGRHTLSPVYNSIIKSCDHGLPRGSHD